MTINLKVLCACLTLVAATNGWIFRTKVCSMKDWPSDWEHDSSGPTYDSKIYSCDLTVEHSGNLSSVVSVVGNHLEGKTNSDVKRIFINNSSTFTSIPSNIGNLLPNLIAVEFRAELITSVTAEDLKQFANVTCLSIYVSPIVSLDGDLFKYTPHIQALFIPSNKIVNVGADLLTNLVDLKVVNFLSNPCLSYYASKPQQVEWIKSNLPSRCPPIVTTAPTTLTTQKPTVPTPPTVTTTQTTSTSPVENCQVRCSLNEETDELSNQLIEQGTLIRNLFEISSEHSHRIFELEKFKENVLRAVRTICA